MAKVKSMGVTGGTIMATIIMAHIAKTINRSAGVH
jgi:hypothetical protein